MQPLGVAIHPGVMLVLIRHADVGLVAPDGGGAGIFRLGLDHVLDDEREAVVKDQVGDGWVARDVEAPKDGLYLLTNAFWP